MSVLRCFAHLGEFKLKIESPARSPDVKLKNVPHSRMVSNTMSVSFELFTNCPRSRLDSDSLHCALETKFSISRAENIN
jgi:hypothetical protein